MINIYELGKKGEDLTVDFLKKQGYIIFKRNYHSRYGEIDVIAEKGELLLFVEVKTRSSDLFGEPKDAVGYRKQEKYKKIANYYKIKYGEIPITFAVAEVTQEGVNLIEDAF